MIAKIKNIKLCPKENGAYWLITIVDQNDCEIGSFGISEKDDPINFRTETFGIMQILNKMNLFELCNKKIEIPILVKRDFLYVESIANTEGDFFSVDKNGNISSGKIENLSEYEPATIVGFESQSGVLALKIKRNYTIQYFQVPSVYLGFKLIHDFRVEENVELESAKRFMYTIYNILRVCKINDLLPQNDRDVIYPQISIVIDSNEKIQSIGNLEENHWLNDEEEKYTLSKEPVKTNATSRKRN